MDWLSGVWQWFGDFSRLEWIVLGGLGLIALLMPAPTHSEINAVREELTKIRQLLESTFRTLCPGVMRVFRGCLQAKLGPTI
jgi:hypothetical protein